MNKRVLLTGSTGLLGANWMALRAGVYPVVGLTHRKKFLDTKYKTAFVDLNDEFATEKFLIEEKIEIIVHAAGFTSVEACEKEPERAFLENTELTKKVALAVKKIGKKLIHVSTDHIFGGNGVFYKETDLPEIVNVYARTKLEAENKILEIMPDALIVRTNFFGWGPTHRPSLSDWVIGKLSKNESIEMYPDIYFCPLYVGSLIETIEALCEKNASGIFNVVGSERVSKYDFGVQLAQRLNLNPSLIRKTNYSPEKSKVRRPRDMSLDVSKVSELLNRKMPTLSQSFDALLEAKSGGLAEKIKCLIGTDFIPYGCHFLDEEDITGVIDVLRSKWLTQGKVVEEFEKSVADYVGAKHAIAVSSLTSGLHIACLAAGIKPGDNVITTPMTFVATSNSILYSGARPVFVDIDPLSLNISPKLIEQECERLNGNVKAIIPVHFGGHSCDMEAISKIAKKYNAIIIEDAAHGLGGYYFSGEKIGCPKYSSMIGFSFHPVKNITTGEGGIITTNDSNIFDHLMRLRSHGISRRTDWMANPKEAFENGVKNSWYYEMQELGFNNRITDIQSALGCTQMRKLDSFLKRRIEIARKYDEAFANLKNAKRVQHRGRGQSGNHLYILRVNYKKLGMHRQKVYDNLMEQGVQAHVHYIPVPMQPYYQKNFAIPESQYKEALSYYREAMTIPLFPSMTDQQVEKVITAILNTIG